MENKKISNSTLNQEITNQIVEEIKQSNRQWSEEEVKNRIAEIILSNQKTQLNDNDNISNSILTTDNNINTQQSSNILDNPEINNNDKSSLINKVKEKSNDSFEYFNNTLKNQSQNSKNESHLNYIYDDAIDSIYRKKDISSLIKDEFKNIKTFFTDLIPSFYSTHPIFSIIFFILFIAVACVSSLLSLLIILLLVILFLIHFSSNSFLDIISLFSNYLKQKLSFAPDDKPSIFDYLKITKLLCALLLSGTKTIEQILKLISNIDLKLAQIVKAILSLPNTIIKLPFKLMNISLGFDGQVSSLQNGIGGASKSLAQGKNMLKTQALNMPKINNKTVSNDNVIVRSKNNDNLSKDTQNNKTNTVAPDTNQNNKNNNLVNDIYNNISTQLPNQVINNNPNIANNINNAITPVDQNNPTTNILNNNISSSISYENNFSSFGKDKERSESKPIFDGLGLNSNTPSLVGEIFNAVKEKISDALTPNPTKELIDMNKNNMNKLDSMEQQNLIDPSKQLENEFLDGDVFTNTLNAFDKMMKKSQPQPTRINFNDADFVEAVIDTITRQQSIEFNQMLSENIANHMNTNNVSIKEAQKHLVKSLVNENIVDINDVVNDLNQKNTFQDKLSEKKNNNSKSNSCNSMNHY